MKVLRSIDRDISVNHRSTQMIPKVIYFSEADLPVFKNRLVSKVNQEVADVPEECSVIIIPIMRGSKPMEVGVGKLNIRLTEPLRLFIGGEHVNSVCDACTLRPECSNFSPDLISCVKAEVENGFI